MKFFSLQPFVPSGPDFEASKNFFTELGFHKTWDGGDYAGFQKDQCAFILQRFNNRSFAENFMISVAVENADAWHQEMKEKKLEEKYGVRISAPSSQPYGREVNLIDLAGVCWHFVQ